MKTSSTALLATMAVASTPAALAATTTLRRSGANEKQSSNEVSASTSSTPGRQLDGKSGKATKASFPATPENFEWIEGEYESADLDLVRMEDGEPIQPEDWESVNTLIKRVHPVKLEIKPLRDYPSLAFQATLNFIFSDYPDYEYRRVLEGVGSLNPAKVDQITFHSDHTEVRFSGGEWVPYTSIPSEEAEAATLECSKVPEYQHGENIVCEYYGNYVWDREDGFVHSEAIFTSAWTKQDTR
jgi:hypothetical protein